MHLLVSVKPVLYCISKQSMVLQKSHNDWNESDGPARAWPEQQGWWKITAIVHQYQICISWTVLDSIGSSHALVEVLSMLLPATIPQIKRCNRFDCKLTWECKAGAPTMAETPNKPSSETTHRQILRPVMCRNGEETPMQGPRHGYACTVQEWRERSQGRSEVRAYFHCTGVERKMAWKGRGQNPSKVRRPEHAFIEQGWIDSSHRKAKGQDPVRAAGPGMPSLWRFHDILQWTRLEWRLPCEGERTEDVFNRTESTMNWKYWNYSRTSANNRSEKSCPARAAGQSRRLSLRVRREVKVISSILLWICRTFCTTKWLPRCRKAVYTVIIEVL